MVAWPAIPGESDERQPGVRIRTCSSEVKEAGGLVSREERSYDDYEETGGLFSLDVDQQAPLLEQYGCGPIQFSGTRDALYERHLTFDRVIDPKKAEPRGQFEAVARSLRDVVSQRWLQTDKTYERKNPKRAYYLSMEFLLGRSLTNNMTHLLLTSFAFEAMQERGVDPLALIEMEPDAGLGNGGLGRLAACFIDWWRTMSALPASSLG